MSIYATALLLKGAPLAASTIKAELTTPTGAAILATVVQEWVESPAMTVRAIGVGAGTKDFLDQPNVLRVFVGDTVRVAYNRLLADRESLVWRYVAVARGLCAAWVP